MSNFKKPDLGPGDKHVAMTDGTEILHRAIGLHRWMYNQWTDFIVNKVTQSVKVKLLDFLATFRGGGHFKWSWQREGNKSFWSFLVTRGWASPMEIVGSMSKAIDADDGVNGDYYGDRVSLRLADSASQHSVDSGTSESSVEQGRMLFFEQRSAKSGEKKGTYKTEVRLGNDGTLGNYLQATMRDENGPNQIKTEILGEDFATRVDINDGKTVINVSHDGSISITTAKSLNVDVNAGAAILDMAETGNTTLTVNNDAMNINLGGKGFEQELLTKNYHDQWVANHTHSNGNNGAPTGAPLLPIVPNALTTRGSENWHTVTTKGE